MEHDFLIGYHNFAGKQRTLGRILGKLQGQVLPDVSSFQAYLQALHRRDVSACTLRTVFTAIHGFLVFLQRKEKAFLSDLATEDLEAFVESEQDRGLKPLSVRGRLHQVYAFLRYLLERGMVPADVLARRIRIKVPDALPRALDAEDVKRLLPVIRKVRDRAMILVLLRTGMRIGELLRTRVSDVQLDERRIQLVVGEKNRTGRVVYLSADACQALKEWIQSRDPGKPLLFYGQGRSSLSYTAARVMFLRYLKKAGISERGYSLHGLRHTCATELLNAGMRLECLQQLLGHSNLEQTRRYARLTDKTREEEYFQAMARIEGGAHHVERRIPGEVPPVFEEAQLLGPHDQNVYEYPGAFPQMVVDPFGRGDLPGGLSLYRLPVGPGVNPEDD
jgi:integrase/recombinase XerD